MFASTSTIAIDQISGRVLYEDNAYEKKLIASTTKIMTAIVAIENGNVNDDVLINDIILKVEGSSIYLEIGEKIKLLDLLYGLMLRSGNDAAVSIANFISKSEAEFVKLMNQKAKSLGMVNTTFINSSGLENDIGNGNVSTAYDMAILMKYAMDNKLFQKIVSTKIYKTKSNLKFFSWKNKNKLLFNYKYTTGGKTGYTKKAKRVLVSSACKDSKKIVIVTINDSNDFVDHKLLYNKLFSEYVLFSVLDKNNGIINDTDYKNGVLYIKNNYSLLLKKEELKSIRMDTIFYKINEYYDGMVVGKINVLLNNDIIHCEYIYMQNSAQKERKFFLSKLLKKIFKN